MKKTFEETVEALKKMGVLLPDETPVKPSRMPLYDDNSPFGIQIFRMGVEGINFSYFDMERSYICRSELRGCIFNNTDLIESNLCWNDFINCDFTGAAFLGSDMRASLYKDVKFTGANLAYTDLRGSEFEDCDFSLADLNGAKLVQGLAGPLGLSYEQVQQVDWQEDEGQEPEGG